MSGLQSGRNVQLCCLERAGIHHVRQSRVWGEQAVPITAPKMMGNEKAQSDAAHHYRRNEVPYFLFSHVGAEFKPILY